MNDKIKTVLANILDCFKSGDIPAVVAQTIFPIPDLPSSNWSLLNRTLMFLSGTADARGYRQWQTTDRHVVKGAKAIHILVPFIKKSDNENGHGEEKRLVGFGCQPVFKVEDTDGAPLAYQQIELPQLPLMERAIQWGISVKAVPGNYQYYGFYSPERKEIGLATPDEKVFFHELSHVSHWNLNNGLNPGQDPLQEIVAELAAQALARMVGKEQTDSTGNSYRYIERYADKLDMNPYTACLKVMSETEKVLNLILQDGSETALAKVA